MTVIVSEEHADRGLPRDKGMPSPQHVHCSSEELRGLSCDAYLATIAPPQPLPAGHLFVHGLFPGVALGPSSVGWGGGVGVGVDACKTPIYDSTAPACPEIGLGFEITCSRMGARVPPAHLVCLDLANTRFSLRSRESETPELGRYPSVTWSRRPHLRKVQTGLTVCRVRIHAQLRDGSQPHPRTVTFCSQSAVDPQCRVQPSGLARSST